MLKTIESERGWTLGNYAADSHLAASVRTLQVEASIFARQLGDRVTKCLHNLIHGQGQPELGPEDREVYELVSRQNAEELAPQVRPDDIVVIHDPQPLAMGAMLKRQLGVRTLWRCHIGLDEDLLTTRAAWSFLKPWAESYDLAIFSAPEYMPDYLAGRVSVIHQLRSGIDGVLIQDPQDPNEIARRLDDILRDVPKREYMARNGRQSVYSFSDRSSHDPFTLQTGCISGAPSYAEGSEAPCLGPLPDQREGLALPVSMRQPRAPCSGTALPLGGAYGSDHPPPP